MDHSAVFIADTGGGRPRSRMRTCLRRAAVLMLLLLHALLTVAVAYFIHPHSASPPPPRQTDNGIYLVYSEGNFSSIWSQKVALHGSNTLELRCAGPYVLYLWACATIYDGKLRKVFVKQGDWTINLLNITSGGGDQCLEEQRVLMLSDKKNVEIQLHPNHTDGVHFSYLHVGLHYMLGSQCFTSPSS